MARKGFVVHHNGPPANCVGQSHARCERFWAAVKRFHGEKFGSKWAATSLYSFGVCPHGVRFSGCGWDRAQAANGSDVVGENDGSDRYWYTVIVFLGTDEKPTMEMVAGVMELISEGRRSDRCGDRVLPHNAFKRKACPGPEFTAYARQWDNRPLSTAALPTTPPEDEMNDSQEAKLDRVTDVVESHTNRLNRIEGTLGRFERQYLSDMRPAIVEALKDAGASASADEIVDKLVERLQT